MIIDSHAYCFEPLDSPRGYSSSKEHIRWVQVAHATHHQPALRIAGDQAWDDGPYRPFWEAVVGLGVPVFFTFGAGPGDLESGRRTKSEEQRGCWGWDEAGRNSWRRRFL